MAYCDIPILTLLTFTVMFLVNRFCVLISVIIVTDVRFVMSFNKNWGVQIGVNTTGRKSGVFEHSEHQWIGATADRSRLPEI